MIEINSTAKLNQNLINSSINSKNKSKTDGVQIRKAKVISVDDDYSYATVKIFGDSGQTLRLINKTGEKLHTGDGVRIEFSTDIVCGWIAMRNGTPDPLCAEFTIENAPIVPQQISNAYLQDAEVFDVDVKNQNIVTYGSERNRIIVQGLLMPVYKGVMPRFKESPNSHVINSAVESESPSFYTITDDEKSFFENNIDCVVNCIPDGALRGVSIELRYAQVYSYNNVETFLWEFKVYGGTRGYLYSSVKPTTVGIMPVVRTISQDKVDLECYGVAYNGNSLVDVVDCGHDYTSWSTNEYDYAMNVLSRSEIKPSEK